MRMKHIIGITVITVGLSAGASLALAKSGEVCDKGGKHATSGHHKPGHNPMQRMMEKLDMDQTQRDNVSTIVEEHRDKMKEQRQSMRDLHRQLHRITVEDNYDEAKARQLADRKARLSADMTVERTRMIHKIYRQMNAEQQEKFRTLRNRHHQDKS